MKIYLDCLPCFLKQVLESSRIVTNDLSIQNKIMEDSIKLVSSYKEYTYSPELGRDMHHIIKKHTKIDDPYKEIKKESIRIAEELYPFLKTFLYKNDEYRLYWALKIAATGNIIDYAIDRDIDIKRTVKNELEKEFAICDLQDFERRLKTAKTLLIIGDNAGETVFDRVLVEELLQSDITYAVRDEAIINDTTYEDACDSGLNVNCKLISSGCNAPGLILEEANDKFLNIFNKADLVISKGQGNFETLSDAKRDIFFLLKVKCPVVADLLDVELNEYIFKLGSAGDRL